MPYFDSSAGPGRAHAGAAAESWDPLKGDFFPPAVHVDAGLSSSPLPSVPLMVASRLCPHIRVSVFRWSGAKRRTRQIFFIHLFIYF